MPPAVDEVFVPLQNELVGIHQRWALYRRVFGHDEDTVDLLNRVSEIFFGHTQWAMYLDLILALCRYTDPAESSKRIGHRPNLTLDRLVNVVTVDDAAFGSALRANEWAAVAKCREDHFEKLRSQTIAHNDLKVMTARFNGQPTDWPSQEQVKRFLTLCTKLMERVFEKYRRCPFVFEGHASYGEGAGETLVRVLAEFSRRHVADVEAGQARWMIRPPRGWPKRPPL